jgi:hypothetical protein
MGKTFSTGLLTNGIWQDASNNIGIGGSPSGSYKFEVTGTGRINSANTTLVLDTTSTSFDASLRLNNNSSATTWGILQAGPGAISGGGMNMYTTGAYPFTLGTNGTERMRITSSGNVGIGTSIPLVKFQITQPNGIGLPTLGTSTGGLFIAGDGNQYGLYIGNDGNTGNSWLQAMRNNTATSYNILLNPVGGNVGIGTSSPLTITNFTSLEVKGSNAGLIAVSSSGGAAFGRMYASGNSVIIGTSTSSNLIFDTNDTERMRITSGGNVGIGGNAGTGRLQVWGENSSSANFAMYVYNSGGFGLFGIRNDGAQFLSGFTYGNTVSGGVRTLYIDSTYALGGISSVRASKKNIQEFNSDWIYNLKPVEFNYRKKDEEGNYTEEVYDEINYGLIAEDTAPIADFLINYNDKEDGSKEMVGIEYSRLITPLLKAIQELSAKVSALENKS